MLCINIDKTCYSIFSPYTKVKDHLHLATVKIEQHQLTRVEHCKYLGVHIDEKLTWEHHIESIYKKLLRFVGIFYKLQNILPDWCLRNIYFSFVHSHLLYGIEMYANTKQIHLDKLEKLNNKLLRILQHKPLLYPTPQLYLNYNTLPIRLLHKFQILSLVHKALYATYKLPPAFATYFCTNDDVHAYYTRASSFPHLERANTSFGQRAIKFKGALLWNNMPSDIRDTMGYNSFQDKLRAILFYKDSNYIVLI